MNRREFLRSSAVAGAGLSLLPLRGVASATEVGVQRRVTLGRTELEIADIGFGSSRLGDDVRLVHHALDRGINYFDSAESYTGGVSETTLGKALRGKRDQLILTSKVKAGVHDTHPQMMQALEGSLRRLQTDYVDIYFNHAVNDPARMQNPEWSEFIERAKQAGKIRFSGMSGHGSRLAECLNEAVEQDRVDVMLVAYNFAQDPGFVQTWKHRLQLLRKDLAKRFDWITVQPDLPSVLAKARAKGVGVVAMKTLRGARKNDMRPYEVGGATFSQAAFRWVLSSPLVDSLIVSMKSPGMIDEYLGASGWNAPHPADVGLLQRYELDHGRSQCRSACDACATACPQQVPIPEVLRTRMYAVDYEDFEFGRRDYQQLETRADACAGCVERSCLTACPDGLPIADLTAEAARLFQS